jgi:hypothetical protein
MKNTIVMFCLSILANFAFGVNMSVMKTRAINSLPGKGVSGEDINSMNSHSGFQKSWSRHWYEITISENNPALTNNTYTLRIMPILKHCKGGIAFPYFKGVLEKQDIKISLKKKIKLVYISPLTIWTKDTWTWNDGSLLGGDMSHGIVNSSIIVEIVKNSEETPIRIWTNSPLPYCRNSIQKAKDYIRKKKPIIFERLTNSDEDIFIDEESCIEETSWREYKEK